MEEQSQEQGLLPEDRRLLLQMARNSIEYGLAHGSPLLIQPEEYSDALQEKRSSFVTLLLDGNLRGCIGGLIPQIPLVEDVVLHAYQSAFSDPRFSPLTEEEYPRLQISISVLSPKESLGDGYSEEELIRLLRPGIDGLILEDGIHTGTFLPAVWETLPDPVDFLTHLKEKAGLPRAYWSPALRFSRYTTETIKDGD